MKHASLFITVLILISSCDQTGQSLNKFSDSRLLTIAELRDRRAADSLLTYFNDPDALYRREAVLAFASIQDSNFVHHVGKILFDDADSSVRAAAAFAIGQTPCIEAENILLEAAGKENEKEVLRELIEAYGKVAKLWKLTLSEDYRLTRSLAWSYYRMAVRGVSDQSLNEKVIKLLKSSDAETRMAAAHYFARGAKDFGSLQHHIIYTALHDSSTDVRMAAALALRKVQSDSSRIATTTLAKNDPDYRVKINAIRALQEIPFSQSKKILLELLNDSVSHVGIAAGETIENSITKDEWAEVTQASRNHKHWRIQADLYAAALSVSNHNELTEEIVLLYNKSTNSYQRGALLTALQHSMMSYGFVREQLLKNNEPVIKVSAALALVGMNYRKDFDQSLKSQFASVYHEAINEGDPAVIGILADALSDSTLGYKTVITDYGFLKDALQKLSLPKDFESIMPLQKAIAYFEGKKFSATLRNDYNHPIPWNDIKNVSRDQQAIIKTSKGHITIRLFVDEAPGSVANFISLALNKFYDGKSFHRVVPNFVVQGGCPRGDGWGSEDYSIRSEFSRRRYKTGSIGMASAGKDTEGTQWFITHSSTPHLDGRYTIFAEVISGMDIVHKLEVGDKILAIEVIGYNAL